MMVLVLSTMTDACTKYYYYYYYYYYYQFLAFISSSVLSVEFCPIAQWLLTVIIRDGVAVCAYHQDHNVINIH